MNSEIVDCIFCGETTCYESLFVINAFKTDCPGCGSYWVSEELLLELNNKKVSLQKKLNCGYQCHELRKVQPKTIPLWVSNVEDVERIQKNVSENVSKNYPSYCTVVAFNQYINLPINHSDKPKRLLEIIGQRLEEHLPFSGFRVRPSERVKAKISDCDELFSILDYLVSKSLIEKKQRFQNNEPSVHAYDIEHSFTVEGWDFISKESAMKSSNKVFIAMQFDWFDQNDLRVDVYNAIKSACLDCGFEADIVKQNHTDYITDRIIGDIRGSKFVVAELSFNNRGVYFESGLARGMGIPVFHIFHEDHIGGEDSMGKKVHFDIQQIRYLKWNDVNKLKQDLKDWIKATI